MSDEDKTAGDGKEAPPLMINTQYIKDMSFEAPTMPGVFSLLQKQQPDIGINIDVNVQPLQESVYEVVLNIKAECKVGETVAFIMELSYGGLFSLNVEPEHLQPVLLIECPRMLFPFARHIVSNATRDGGFPPLMVGPVDFVAMYQQQLARRANQEKESPPDTATA